MEKSRTGAASAVVLILVAAVGSAAHADNAFPTSQSVLLPADRPNEIIVGTTFGLVFSEDDAATWAYGCEQREVTRSGRQYRMGPAPEHRLFAVSDLGAPMSSDGACTWMLPRGPLASLLALDVWPDPSLPSRAFVLALNAADAVVSAFRSADGGATYQGPVFVSPVDVRVTGIESATTNADIVYMTAQRRSDAHPMLWRSEDGGDTWTSTDIEPGVGPVTPRLVAVDATDADRVFLLLQSGTPETQEVQSLAITTDAGATWSVPLTLPGGTLTGFTRLADGTLLAAGSVAATAVKPPLLTPTLFRSEDGGLTFVAEAVPFHPSGLTRRDDVVFAAADNFRDGFALASSPDGGRTWTPRMRFRDISAVKSCLRAVCQQDCDDQAGIKLFPPETCNPLDGGGGADAAVDRPPARHTDGCGCVVAHAPMGPAPLSLLFLVVGGLVASRRRRSPPGSVPGEPGPGRGRRTFCRRAVQDRG